MLSQNMVDFEYIRSLGAHGVHHHGAFHAFVGVEREIWIGSDASGLIRESRGTVDFFTDQGRARWQAAGAPELKHGPSLDLFAPGCLGVSRARRARLSDDPQALEKALNRYSPLELSDLPGWVGEAVVTPEFACRLYEIAQSLPEVRTLPELADRLGRRGLGLIAIEGESRRELIFSADRGQLLGYQYYFDQPQPFAPAGALHSWTAYVDRAIVDRLPPQIRATPTFPCEPSGAGRGFPIRPGLSLMTGYVNDPVSQLRELRDDGVITATEYDSALSYQAPTDNERPG